MRGRMFAAFTALLLLFTLGPCGASAAGESDAGRMEIQNQTYANDVFSCDVKLSGAAIEGHVFAELFAQSGQAKKVAEYPAKQTVQVKLTDTDPTDYVRVIWTDDVYMPIVGPETRRMPDNNAQAYAAFEAALGEQLRPDGIGASAGSNRLLVSCTEALNWNAFEGLDVVVPGPNHHYVLQFESPAKASKCKEKLESMPSVRYVEFDSAMTFEKEEDEQEETARTLSADALSWGVERSGIDQYVAALKSKGINREIIVAVVDSGIDKNHEFLNGVLLDGHSSIPKNSSVQDEYEHGTHVAGIIADCTRGMNVKILPVRVLDRFGSASPSTVASGICYAADHGANVINLSLGYFEHRKWIDEAIEYALSKNITVVAAACNFNTDAKSFCPAHMEDCITVAALERDGNNNLKRWGASNYGSAVDLSAAGGGVYSSMPGNQYRNDSGTSMAAPHVSAAAALLMCERGISQTPSQISDALKNAAETLTLNKPLGAGFLNMRPFAETTVNVSVKFDANGGTGSMATLTTPYGKEITLKRNEFSRENYLFAYWNTAPDGSGMFYYDGETLTPERDMTLYAQWQPLVPEPIPTKPISWGTTATHMDEYAALLQQREMSSEVIVAEIDTGVDASHPFLKDRLVAGYDFVEDDDTPQDENGHGTHVAGIIADCTPDNVKIMPVRVLNAKGVGSYSNTNAGIYYAANHGANVICLPLSSAIHTQVMEEAIQYAIDRNVTVVTSAGNYNSEASGYCPAHMDECVTVAAVDQSLKRYRHSNYGEAVDIAAPGEDIYSCAPDGEYGTMSGTSFCAAYVSGAAAALMCDYGVSQTPAQIANLLKRAAMPIPDDEDDAKKTLGAGFLDMTAFINGGVEEQAFYAMLYDDGEMVFQKDAVPDATRTLLQSYPISTAEGGSVAQRAAWYSRREQIRTVSFADAIRPVSTALWFHDCENLSEIWGLENLDVSLVTDMSQMFSGCGALTFLDLSALNVRSADNLRQMFFDCANLTTLDLTGWNTANVTNMSDMFSGCSALETVCASETFTTGAVSDSAGMFDGCAALSGGAGTKCDGIHTDKEYARIDTADAPGYFTDKNAQYHAVIEIGVVSGAPGELARIPVSITQNPGIAAMDMNLLFDSALTLQRVSKGEVLSEGLFDSNAEQARIVWACDSMNGADTGVFLNLTFQISPDAESGTHAVSLAMETLWDYNGNSVRVEIQSGAIEVLKSESEENGVYALLYGDGELVFQNNRRTDSSRTVTDVYKVDESYSYYQNAPWHEQRESITTVTFADTIKPQTTSYWFYQCWNLENIRGIERIDTDNVTDMSGMFCICKSLTNLNVSAFNTANVTNMSYMFYGCSGLTSLDVSAFNTANVTSMDYMFYGCSGLTSLNVSGFDTANVTNMDSMFAQCSGLFTLDLSNFNTENVKSTSYMFKECSGMTTLDISGFHTANVTNMSGMFSQCGQLMTIYASSLFVIDSESNSWCFMFDGCVSLVGGAGTTYQSNSIEKYHARIDGGPDAPGYFTAKALWGDVDGDGKVTQNDYQVIVEMAMGNLQFDNRMYDAANVDGIDGITMADALMVSRYLSGS